MIESVAGAIANPIPTPMITSTTATRSYPLVTVMREKTSSARPTRPSPAATTTLVPIRATSLALTGAATISAAATGRRQAPDSSAEYPSTNCRYWLMKNIDPNIAKNTSVIDTDAAVKRGFLKKVTSRIGWSVWRSHRMNDPSSTTAAAPHPMITGLVQPRVGPSMIANSSATRPNIESRVPTKSRRVACSSFEFGTSTIDASTATMTIGTFTRKIAPHQ